MEQEKHVNVSYLNDEKLLEYQLAIQARLGELAVFNADCQAEWDRRYPPQPQQ